MSYHFCRTNPCPICTFEHRVATPGVPVRFTDYFDIPESDPEMGGFYDGDLTVFDDPASVDS
jgi:hypothetical protein